MASGCLMSPKRDEGGADGGDGEGEPAGRVHALAGKEGGGHGMVPTMSEAWETVVRLRPENWMRN